MGDVLEQIKEWDGALEHRQHAAASCAEGARFKLAITQLRRGDFEDGFANYEARLGLPVWIEQALPAAGSLAMDRLLRPGQPVRDRQIVLFTEQGLGDTFLEPASFPSLPSAVLASPWFVACRCDLCLRAFLFSR